MNEDGNRTFYDKAEVIEALSYWVDLSRKHKVHPPGIVEWGTTPKDFFERKRAMMWTTTGNLTNVRNYAKFPFGVGDVAGGQAPWQPDRWRQFLYLQQGAAFSAGGGLQVHPLDHHSRAGSAVVCRHWLRGGAT
jgi:sn-glycerol 3-phosphate transport system substrate-binding protein